MKRFLDIFMPFYVHNKHLTKRLTWKKKVGFFIFYLDRFVYSPLFQIIFLNKTLVEQSALKSRWSKRFFQKLGFVFCDSVSQKEDLVEQNVMNKEASPKKKNDIPKEKKQENEEKNEGTYYIDDEVAALWPQRISYVAPLRVQHKKESNNFNVIYIGHMSVLIQTKDFNILIDPVLSQTIGIFNILGVKRRIQPGITFNNLPSIDFILLSNNRYDTMDKYFLKRIILRDNSIILGGMNIRRYLLKRNFPVVYPLDWFDHVSFENISFHYLPTCSNSSRVVLDKNVYLPGSFLIQDNNGSIFYSGHTSYSDHFVKVKNYLQNNLPETSHHCLDLSILPMGIYKPRVLYEPFHMSPREALQAHHDLNSKRGLGIGHDVFCLGGEKYGEATEELKAVLSLYEKKKNEKINFITLKPGQNMIF